MWRKLISHCTERTCPQLWPIINLTKNKFTIIRVNHSWTETKQKNLRIWIQHCSATIALDRIIRQTVRNSLCLFQWGITITKKLIKFKVFIKFLANNTYRHPKGTTILVASNRVAGHTFHENLTPSRSSGPYKSNCCIMRSKSENRYIIYIYIKKRKITKYQLKAQKNFATTNINKQIHCESQIPNV